jgi:hypothetical protein
MRFVAMLAVALAIAGWAAGAEEGMPRVKVYRGGERELSGEVKARVADWAAKFLESANFSTANQPDILQQSVGEIAERYRKEVRGDFLVVSYARARTVKTVGGEVQVLEIVVGLNRQDEYASALFTIDREARVVAHEKYAAMKVPGEVGKR